MEFSDFIKEYRIRVKEFADAVDYTPVHISNILRGKGNPSAKLKRRMQEFKDSYMCELKRKVNNASAATQN